MLKQHTTRVVMIVMATSTLVLLAQAIQESSIRDNPQLSIEVTQFDVETGESVVQISNPTDQTICIWDFGFSRRIRRGHTTS